MEASNKRKDVLARLDQAIAETKDKKAHSISLENAQERSFKLLSDEEIALVLAYRAKKVRLQKDIKQSDMHAKANFTSASSYRTFEQSGKITLLNFIKVLRVFGRLDEIENLLRLTLLDKINSFDEPEKSTKKRVRNKDIMNR